MAFLVVSIMKNSIIITGITGVGKTTIGRSLANSLNFEFIDLDKSIELSCGVDIQTIFAIENEEGFRKRETEELLKVITNRTNYVLSLGGGCVISDKNREIIKTSNSVVIQLFADIEILVQRLSRSVNKRPLLENVDLHGKILELYKSRQKFYDEVTNHTVNTSRLKPSQIINEIKKYL